MANDRFNPLLQQTINQRLQGRGVDLAPFFGAQRQFLGAQSRASEEAQQRQVLTSAVTRGTGRSGATAAAQRGVRAQAAGQRRGTEAQLGLQEQLQRQQAIQDAIAAGLQGEQIGVQERLGQEQLALQREQLQEQIRQFNLQNQPPTFGEILGEGVGAAAGLFGAGGAFPNFFGLLGGQQE